MDRVVLRRAGAASLRRAWTRAFQLVLLFIVPHVLWNPAVHFGRLRQVIAGLRRIPLWVTPVFLWHIFNTFLVVLWRRLRGTPKSERWPMAVEFAVEATRPHASFLQNWDKVIEPAIESITATDYYFGRAVAFVCHPRMKFESVTKSCPRPFTWLWFEEPEMATLPEVVILFLHGGGHWAFTGASHFEYVGRFLKALRLSGIRGRACVLDTRRAPEHPWPAALEDAIATYDWLQRAAGVDHSRIIFAGDSAGGGLCVCLLKASRDAKVPQPLCSVVVSPLTDLSRTADDYQNGGANPQNPLISPKFGELHALSPILIQAGSSELLVRDSVELAKRLEVYRGKVCLELYPEMPHVFPMFACLGLKDGQTAINQQATFVRNQLFGYDNTDDKSLCVSVHDHRTRSFENVRDLDEVRTRLPSISSSPTVRETAGASLREAVRSKTLRGTQSPPKRRAA
eukprot:TRINITY_DN29458_c0_g2_i2.p1 TRINITY_DN29458_c0_g2~~TRINITY_DN29458_c0_g2_i2.p1  ORF type:complete len:455 (-),score=51.49 TRINITY_DN29458_c0_g2_i2:163-1527(-)